MGVRERRLWVVLVSVVAVGSEEPGGANFSSKPVMRRTGPEAGPGPREGAVVCLGVCLDDFFCPFVDFFSYEPHPFAFFKPLSACSACGAALLSLAMARRQEAQASLFIRGRLIRPLLPPSGRHHHAWPHSPLQRRSSTGPLAPLQRPLLDPNHSLDDGHAGGALGRDMGRVPRTAGPAPRSATRTEDLPRPKLR